MSRKNEGNLKPKRGATSNNILQSEDQWEQNQDQNCRFHQLPRGLIVDILSRLSVITIFNCRLVCKPWFLLTSDSHFARLHQSKSHSGSSAGILLNPRWTPNLDFYHIEEKREGGDLQIQSLGFTLAVSNPSSKQIFLRNSCNGFLCLSGFGFGYPYGRIYLCNPILGEYIGIPASNAYYQPDLVALGFNDRTNEYKVLEVADQRRRGLDVLNAYSVDQRWEAEIYTVGTGVWRSVGEAPILERTSSVNNTLVHGALHWFARSWMTSFSTIWSFDFRSEQFREVPPPSLPLNSSDKYRRIGVLQGCLLLSMYTKNLSIFEMWIMKDYGVQESWTKILFLENWGNPETSRFTWTCDPFMLLSGGEILMIHNNQTVVRYSPEEKNLVDARIFGTKDAYGNSVTLSEEADYTPCFVSLKDIANGEELLYATPRFAFLKDAAN